MLVSHELTLPCTGDAAALSFFVRVLAFAILAKHPFPNHSLGQWVMSTTVNLLTWMIVIQSVWAPTMNTQAWMDGLSTALAS